MSSLKDIKMLVLDIDGTMTSGEIILSNSGEESKAFHVIDGAAVVWFRQLVGPVMFLSGRESVAVEHRAKQLGVKHCCLGVHNKPAVLKAVLEDEGIGLNEVAMVGDDLIDLGVMSIVGVSACPSDAVREVKKRVDFCAEALAGHGAVREFIEAILKEKGLWDKLVNDYATASHKMISPLGNPQ